MEGFLDVEALQRQLTESIEALGKQRKEEAARFEKETKERNQLAEAERQRQLAEYQENQKRRDEKRRAEEELAAKRVQEERARRTSLENSLAAAEEARRKQEERLQWLVSEINKQEFIEEQHRKSLQSTAQSAHVNEKPTDINVEHPEAPLNTLAPGEAVQGTSGDTPEDNLMSTHLKHILRQATRPE